MSAEAHPAEPLFAPLPSRALVRVGGPDWRGFLQGLLTQDVETLADGEIRFAGLLTPQGRLLFDLFVVGRPSGCVLDCAADQRDDLVRSLTMYRLRAKVEVEPAGDRIAAVWGVGAAPPGWVADPRLPELGLRGYGTRAPGGSLAVDEARYERHRIGLGVPGPADWGVNATYPIEADFDLLAGIDFRKGCFVGQETTSRMKRRGLVKSRMLRVAFDGPPPPHGAELLAGALRAGRALSGVDGMSIALLRLDRLGAGELRLEDGRPWRPASPSWFEALGDQEASGEVQLP